MRFSLKYILPVAAALLLLAAPASAQYANYKPKKDKATKLYGYIDKKTKEWMIAPDFNKAKRFDGALAVVTVDKMDGLIGPDGAFILPAEFNRLIIDNSLGIVQGERFLLVGGEGPCADNVIRLWGVYDQKGNEVIAPYYESRFYFNRYGISVAQLGTTKKYGLISMAGRVITPFDYFAISKDISRYFALDSKFLLHEFDLEGHELNRGVGPRPGYVKPYDPGTDDVKAVVYKRMLIGERLYRNSVYAIDNPGAAYVVGHGRLLVKRITNVTTGNYVNWGDYDENFLRLNLVECGPDVKYAMYYKPTDRYYTIEADVCAPDGTVKWVASDFGWYEAVCDQGIIYNAGGEELWFLAYDRNFPARLKYFDITGYLKGRAPTVSAAFDFTSDDTRLLDSWYKLADLRKSIELAENCGLSSYEYPPIPGASEPYIEKLEKKYPVLRRMFGIGEVLSGKITWPDGPEGTAVLKYSPDLTVPLIDHYEAVSLTNESKETVFWGADNLRYVKLDLVPFSIKRHSVTNPLEVGYLWDDTESSSFGYSIAVNLYESDGYFVRTLGVSNELSACEDHIIVLGDLGMVFTDIIPDTPGKLVFYVHNPSTNLLSGLANCNFQ
ncbi:MAG: WG repeat-containing protein [Bacteroidales bacterium]|nr:WG repeat-containing protein [Bacteroidales bacterium]